MRIAPLLLVLALAGCSSSLQANILESERFTIGSVTAGTERSDTGDITDAALAFPTDARRIVFNVELENLQRTTSVTGYWMLEGDTGRFASYTLTATPERHLARFEINKASDWPIGTYLFYVEATDGTMSADKLFRYQIEGR